MHICTCTPSYVPYAGGAEIGMHGVLSHLAAKTTHRFSVVTATQEALPAQETIDGVEVFRYHQPKIWARWFAPTLNSFLPTARLLRMLHPDLVHIHFVLPTGLAAQIAARKLGLPSLMSLGGKDIYDPIDAPPHTLRAIAAYYIQRTSLIAYSTFTRQYLIDHYGAAPEQVRQIPFGVDTIRFRPGIDGHTVRERYGIRPDQVVILSLQRLEQRKAVDILIKAVGQVARYFPDIRVLIGGEGREAPSLRGLREALGLQERVIFCGFVPETEKARYYGAADIFALHSYHEGLGIVLAEASSAGLPVVTTRAGGTVDVVIDEVTGLLVEPGDPEALAEALHTLIADPEKRRAMGKAGREHVASHFSLDVVASAYMQAFEQAYSSQVR